jgi:ribA/ribD-fused uncharacterized protein
MSLPESVKQTEPFVKPPKTLEELLVAIADRSAPKFVFFWGHQPSADGAITKTCFSQWWIAPFSVDKVEYRTAEHFMMASKARLFGDTATLERILAAPHPKQAKDLGRSVADFDEAIWLAHRFDFVVAVNQAKFSQHSNLANFLLGTGQRILVEASPADRIWGIGLAADSPAATRPDQWRGLNLLGFALMQVRHSLLLSAETR